MISPALLTALVCAYLLGAIPTGFILGKWLKGIDIRQHGSGNPGATNVFRTVGVGAGIAALAFDIFKGWLPVWIALRIWPGQPWPAILTGAAAICGHNWTVFLQFRGGKGVATSTGVFGALLPGPMGIAILVFTLTLLVTQFVSAGSMVSSAAFAIAVWESSAPTALKWASAAAAMLVIVLHHKNIARILKGQEPKVPLWKKREGKLS